MKILNIGSINKDFFYSVKNIVKPGETISSKNLSVKIGGKGLNQSVAVSKGGHKIYHAGIINKNDTFILDKLKEWGVDIQNIILSDNPTGHAIIQVEKNGENSILINSGANYDFNLNFISSTVEKFNEGDLLLVQNETNLINEIIKIAHSKKMNIIFNPAPFDNSIHNYNLEKVSTLIVNKIEGEGLTGEKKPSKILKILNEKFKNTEIILTLGKKGSLYSYKKNKITVKAFPVKSVDTTGAGDTFIGYFIASRAKNMTIKDSLERASKAAALSTTQFGGAESIPVID